MSWNPFYSDIKESYINDYVLDESKADELKFANWLKKWGVPEENVKPMIDTFNKIKPRLKQEQRDLYYWIKKDNYIEFETTIDSILKAPTNKDKEKTAKEGARVVYHDDNWLVLEITNAQAAQKYGKNTKWCISGSKRWADGNHTGEQYFNTYYNDDKVRFYFFINRETKYALALYPDNVHYEIYNAEDVKVSYIPNAPEVEEIEVHYTKDKLTDKELIVNAFLTGKMKDSTLISIASKLVEEEGNGSHYIIWCLDSKADVSAELNDLIPDEFIEYGEVESGNQTPEWYKEITGEDYDDFGWGGDIPAFDLLDSPLKAIQSTKEETIDPKNIEDYKYYILYNSDYDGDHLVGIEDSIGLYQFFNSFIGSNVTSDEDEDELLKEFGGNRVDLVAIKVTNRMLDIIKNNEEGANDYLEELKSIGCSKEFLNSLKQHQEAMLN